MILKYYLKIAITKNNINRFEIDANKLSKKNIKLYYGKC